MRPTSGGDALLPAARPRSRKSSVADHAVHTATTHTPTSFFLRSEEDIEKSLVESTSTVSASKQRDSTYGVQSLADALESAFGDTAGDENTNKTNASGRKVDKQDVTPRMSSRGSHETADGRDDSSPKSASVRKHNLTHAVQHAIPTSLSPSNIDSPIPESAMPSTPRSVSLKSFRLSDEESGADEATSQAIASSEDDEEDTHVEDSGSFPQLVMPSIQMPSRRPFTGKGKNMGRLKVLIAGEAGVGKTSLIRSIVQLCEDIVHVDPLSHTQVDSPPPRSKSRKRRSDTTGTTRIMEVHASTRAYPSWWSDMEESRVLRRRKSMGDTVLERNLCFIDTPGYVKDGSDAENMDLVIEYVESLLHRNVSMGTMSDGDLLGIISGHGGLQVDLIFYLISPNDDLSADIDHIKRLSTLTNVIPLISKADTLTSSQIISLKNTLLTRLQATSIKPFFFGKSIEECHLATQHQTKPSPEPSPDRGSPIQNDSPQLPSHLSMPNPPYAISSTPGPDTETMDASLLMSPDYVQPLLPSELAVLVNQVFDPETISWLRHSAAKKFLAWRSRTNFTGDSLIMHGYPQQRGLNPLGLNTGGLGSKSLQDPFSRLTTAPPSSTSSIFSAASPSGVLVPHPHSPFYLSHANSHSNLQSPYPASSPSLSHSPLHDLDGPTDFSLTRFRDHTQREERFAQVRMAKWASDLQRSLQNERERFEELQRGERAKWLLERVGEEVRGGSIASSPPAPARADWAVVRHGSEKRINGAARYGRQGRVDTRDPLGLCDFTDEVRRRGTVVFKVLGGMGVLGAVVVAVIKACGIDTGMPEGGVWAWLVGSGE